MLREDDRVDLGPLLSDGTLLRDLIDVDKREVSLRVMTDPELYQLELERLFARAWIGVAHDTEIPNPGDYVTRYIGEDQVIVTRGGDNEVSVLLNVCSHRGMQVCRSECGNATRFRCPYHGWTFGSVGQLQAVPLKKEMFGSQLDQSALGLQRARAATCAGIVFATWDDQAPSLEEYLGPIKWYLEAMYCRSDDGFEVVGAPQRFIIPSNWKCGAEQWSGDGYHTMTLHHSIDELGLARFDPKELIGTSVGTPAGHVVRCFDLKNILNAFRGAEAAPMSTLETLTLFPPSGMSADMVDQLERNLDAGQLEMLANAPPTVGVLFPNWMLWNSPGFNGGSVARFNTGIPRGPNAFELVSWALVEKGASPEMKELARKTSNLTAGISGFIEQDDAEVWPAIQRGAKGAIGRRQSMKYLALGGLDEPDDWYGGGDYYPHTKDDTQWNWWLRYLDYMTGAPW